MKGVAAATSPSPCHLHEERAIFEHFDDNKDGKISGEEILSKLHCMGLSISHDELNKLMIKSGANADGLINFDGFVTVYRDLMGRSHGGGASGNDIASDSELEGGADESLKEAFRVFDADGNGLISAQELHEALKTIGFEGRKLSDCVNMIKRVDSDGNGHVDYEEFKAMMK